MSSHANHTDYWRFVLANKLVNPLTQAHKGALDEADKLCAQCLKSGSSVFLCSGQRRWFDAEESEARKTPVIIQHTCDKMRQHRQTRHTLDLWADTYMWPNTVAAYQAEIARGDTRATAVVHIGDAGPTILGKPVPLFTQFDNADQNERKRLQEYVVAYVNAGYRAAYIRSRDIWLAIGRNTREMSLKNQSMPVHLKLHGSIEFHQAVLTGVDWLVVCDVAADRLTSQHEDAEQDFICGIIASRIDRGLQTSVGVSKGQLERMSSQWRPTIEGVHEWQKFPMF